MKKYASQHEAQIRKFVEEKLSQGMERKAIVRLLHEEYFDRAYLTNLVRDVADPKSSAQLKWINRVLSSMLLLSALYSTASGLISLRGGAFPFQFLLLPVYLYLAHMVRRSRVTGYNATEYFGWMWLIWHGFIVSRFGASNILSVPLVIEAIWIGIMAIIAKRAKRSANPEYDMVA